MVVDTAERSESISQAALEHKKQSRKIYVIVLDHSMLKRIASPLPVSNRPFRCS